MGELRTRARGDRQYGLRLGGMWVKGIRKIYASTRRAQHNVTEKLFKLFAGNCLVVSAPFYEEKRRFCRYNYKSSTYGF